MIIDKLENLEKYVSLNPLFADVVDFIKKNDKIDFPCGNKAVSLAAGDAGIVKIKGDELFANFNICKGKTKTDAKLETHNAMIDIQIPLNHPEIMGYTPREDLAEVPYNAEKDISFYEGEAQQYLTIQPGMFVIFFPQDGHAPAICEAEELHKIIFKVKV